MRSHAAEHFEKIDQRAVSAHADRIAYIAEVEETGEWRADGIVDFTAWVAALAKESMQTARAWIREARALKVRPALQRALLDGQVSVGQSKLITALARENTDDDARWLECLPSWEYPDLEREARKATARKLEREGRDTYCRTWHTPDERYVRGEFQLHPADGAAVMAAIDARIPKDTRFKDLDRAAATALVEVATGSVVKAKPTVLLAVGNDVAALSSGGFVSAKTAERLACSGKIQRVHVDGAGNLIGTEPNTTAIPASTERAVYARDHGQCTFPKCERDRVLEVHHIVWREYGGSNDLSNLQLVCLKHHKWVHEEGWSLGDRAGHANTWFRPDGTPYEPFDTS